MANQIYESTYLVTSFHAINESTGEAVEANEQGYITASAGDKFVFKSLYGDHFVDLNTITFFTKDTGIKVQINDDELYPIYVDANSFKSVQYIRVHSFTVLQDCTFYFEGLTSE